MSKNHFFTLVSGFVLLFSLNLSAQVATLEFNDDIEETPFNPITTDNLTGQKTLLERANYFYQKKDYKKATSFYNKLLLEESSLFKLTDYANAGECFCNNGEKEKASLFFIKYYREYKKLHGYNTINDFISSLEKQKAKKELISCIKASLMPAKTF